MKRAPRALLVLCMSLSSAGLTGCQPPTMTFKVHLFEQQPSRRTIPIRVGVLPPVDSRGESERHPRLVPSASVVVMSLVAFVQVRKGARMRSDRHLRLPPDPAHAFGNRTVVDALGSYVVRVIRDTHAFEALEPVQVGNWRIDQLPHIARLTGYRYFLGMDIRHFYALRHVEEILAGVNTSMITGTPSSWHMQLEPEHSPAIETTVIRLRLYEVDADHVRVFWQMSARASRYTIDSDDSISGSDTTADCLNQLAAGINELTRQLGPDTLPDMSIGGRSGASSSTAIP